MFFLKIYRKISGLLTVMILLIVQLTFAQDKSKVNYDTIPNLFQSNQYLGQTTQKTDYQALMNITDRYFNKYPIMREKMEEYFKNYQRWKYYWKDRMSRVGRKVTGSRYMQKMKLNRLKRITASKKTATPICHRSNHQPNWQLLGPKKKYSDQQRGRLISVAVHPNDTNTIYAGSWQSGLYKTTEHEETWKHMTDSKQKALVFMIG